MGTIAINSSPLWPLALYCGLAFVLVAGVLAASYVAGERHRDRATGTAYESGVPPAGASRRLRLSADFYLVAILFVIFDVEAVFLFAWAVVARRAGWSGYVEAMAFVGVLMASLVYLERIGALDWGSSARRRVDAEAAGNEPRTNG